MRILFVAIANSIHTARWVRQFSGLGWDLHLFPTLDVRLHPEITAVNYHPPRGSRSGRRNPGVRVPGTNPVTAPLWRRARRWLPDRFDESERLARLIDELRPDVVHTMELQQAAYLMLEAKRRLRGGGRPWLATNWGSDLYFFARLAEHRPRVERVLAECDYYDCECERDQRIARELGCRAPMFPAAPNAGGFDLERCAQLRSPGPTSRRKTILIKGYQNWSGRAMTALRAVELAADALRGYRIGVYLANDDVELTAKAVSGTTGLPIEIIPKVPHEEMLRRHGAARISLGVSASDGLSTSFLEGLAMGAFPIQSHDAAADEWVEHGKTGMIVDTDDPRGIADALRRAATDDRLVDDAVEANDRVCRERLDYGVVRRQAIEMYESIAGAGAAAPAAGRRAA